MPYFQQLTQERRYFTTLRKCFLYGGEGRPICKSLQIIVIRRKCSLEYRLEWLWSIEAATTKSEATRQPVRRCPAPSRTTLRPRRNHLREYCKAKPRR